MQSFIWNNNSWHSGHRIRCFGTKESNFTLVEGKNQQLWPLDLLTPWSFAAVLITSCGSVPSTDERSHRSMKICLPHWNPVYPTAVVSRSGLTVCWCYVLVLTQLIRWSLFRSGVRKIFLINPGNSSNIRVMRSQRRTLQDAPPMQNVGTINLPLLLTLAWHLWNLIIIDPTTRLTLSATCSAAWRC